MINQLLGGLAILSAWIFNRHKYLIWHQRKLILFSLFLILMKPFIDFLNLSSNSIYKLADNGL